MTESSATTLRVKRARGFTLVEMMVSLALLLLLMVVTVTILNAVSKIDNQARSKVDTFREARAGFELMTRRVSQSMLNTYWDYFDASGISRTTANASTFVAKTYDRQSELHFVTGPTKLGSSPLLPDAGVQSVTHGIFFQSPQGFTSDPNPAVTASANLPNLLNASGYYIEYSSDQADRPAFLKDSSEVAAPPVRWRFRLMEFNQGSEYFQVYRSTSAGTAATALDWFRLPIKDRLTYPKPIVTRVLAENVVGLFVLPHRSNNDTFASSGTLQQLAPNYYYNSREYVASPTATLPKLTKNQLPPMVQVTMVVIDERSAVRLQDMMGSTPEQMSVATGILGLSSGIFVKASTATTGANDRDQYIADLKTLEAKLNSLRLTYRVFSTEVSIFQAKWSEN